SGKVVGVDTALYNPDEAGGFIGIRLAIPASKAKFFVEDLLDSQHGKPGLLGFKLQGMTPALGEALGIPHVKGAVIESVGAGGRGGRASKVDLRPGDVLGASNGVRQTDSRAFMRAIVQIRPGQPSELTIWRDGKDQLVTAAVEEWPNFMPGGGLMTEHAEAMI